METIELEEEAFEDLRTAFEHNRLDTECYLDTEEGRVIWFSSDAPPVREEPDEDDPEWVHEAYQKRMTVWQDGNGRFLEVPPGDVIDACKDMEKFLADHASDELARRFESSGKNRKTLEAFQRAVERDAMHRRQWRKFRRERICDRVRDWLELQGYRLSLP